MDSTPCSRREVKGHVFAGLACFGGSAEDLCGILAQVGDEAKRM